MNKTTKSVSLHLLIALTLLSTALAHQCSDNCYKCFGEDNCAFCYRRKLLTNSDGNGGFCSTKPLPATDHCLVYFSETGCATCEQGWAKVQGGAKTCVKGNIKDCHNEQVQNGKHSCFSCLNGYPSKDQSRCIPASQYKGAIANCKIGATVFLSPEPICKECVAGYTSDLKKCFKTTAALKGCVQSFKDTCTVCDAQAGYFNRDLLTCSKNGNAVKMF